MRELGELAEQIRVVRDAERRFMSLWRIEQVLIGPEVLDRLEQDIAEVAQLAGELLALSRSAVINDRGYHRPSSWSINDMRGADGAN